MRSLATMALVMWFGSIGAASAAAPLAPPSGSTAAEGTSVSIALVPGTWFTRTELFFGSLTPDGSVVSEDADPSSPQAVARSARVARAMTMVRRVLAEGCHRQTGA